MRRMTHQALQRAQARLDQLQRQSDESFTAHDANPSIDLKKERYEDLKLSLHKAENVVNSLATAAVAASAQVSRGTLPYTAQPAYTSVVFLHSCLHIQT